MKFGFRIVGLDLKISQRPGFDNVIVPELHQAIISKVTKTSPLPTPSIVSTDLASIKKACHNHPVLGGGKNPVSQALIEDYITLSHEISAAGYTQIVPLLTKLNTCLACRSALVGYELTLSDVACFCALKDSKVWSGKNFDHDSFAHVKRWMGWVADDVNISSALNQAKDQLKSANKEIKDVASYDIDLPGAVKGKVVTRFPPEPSGYLHIGHAKAALLNEYYAKAFEGKMLLRFDDTNPSKEKGEFEQSIIEDLALLGIKADNLSYTSDHFDFLEQKAKEAIRKSLVYADDTPTEQMREERLNLQPSSCRNRSVEENLKDFEEMLKGSERGLKVCLRFKLDYQSKNGALRDPVIYRCNLDPHHRTGTKYKAYPTYDFCCPIVDSIEGVTHALRTIEYRDRYDQYMMILDKMEMRKPHITEFSRMNFEYTLLSKRKLTVMVDKGIVTGWDDPRLPTVRGVRRRGMTIEGLREYIKMQGPSKTDVALAWDKIWAVNRQKIDPIAPRYTCIQDQPYILTVQSGMQPFVKQVPKHKKNSDLGTKTLTCTESIYVEAVDAITFEQGEEITLMDWGNVFVRSIQGKTIYVDLNIGGDVRKTKKVTWLPKIPELVNCILVDYDFVITKSKMEEEDKLDDVLNPVTEFKAQAKGDPLLKTLAKGDIIQLERKGFYICDKAFDGNNVVLIRIPDGKSDTVTLKYKGNVGEKKLVHDVAPLTDLGSVDVSGVKMYQVKPLV